MHIRTPAIVCALRQHGETGAIVRLLTAGHGMIAAYVAGARGRTLRPVLIPGNRVDAQVASRSESQLPFAQVELLESRGPWLGEPLPAAGIAWATSLAAATLPERHPYPALYEVLAGLLQAICVAPSARGWVMPMMDYERLVLRELGYGGALVRPDPQDWPAMLQAFDRLGPDLSRYLLADRRGDVMAARTMLRDRLARMSPD